MDFIQEDIFLFGEGGGSSDQTVVGEGEGGGSSDQAVGGEEEGCSSDQAVVGERETLVIKL